MRCGVPRSHRGLAWHQHSMAACLQRMRLMVALVRPTRTAKDLYQKPSWASSSTSCLILIGVGRGMIITIRENREKLCNCWLKRATVLRQIWGNDHIICSFGFRPPRLALQWKSSQSKVVFHWQTVTGIFHVNFSPFWSTKTRSISILLPQMGV